MRYTRDNDILKHITQTGDNPYGYAIYFRLYSVIA